MCWSRLFHHEPKRPWVTGMITGLAELVYVGIVIGTLMTLAGDKAIEKTAPPVVAGFLYLSVLVFSVAVSGLLIFGYPIWLGFRGQYRAALLAVAGSLGTLAIVILLALTGILLVW